MKYLQITKKCYVLKWGISYYQKDIVHDNCMEKDLQSKRKMLDRTFSVTGSAQENKHWGTQQPNTWCINIPAYRADDINNIFRSSNDFRSISLQWWVLNKNTTYYICTASI
jgi:hypothetical protein